ncbi:MAG: hypothetical protein FWC03_10935 [Treponema sp.]|nr:hypothetical protein [Treponema sp.]
MAINRIILIILFSFIFMQCKEANDSKRFAKEYPLAGDDNIFLYRNASETADILEKGRGIVLIGFKECSWCQHYAVILQDVAREMEIDRIYYCDIRKDREKNSENYQRIVRILSDRLQYDDEGRERVYVPDVSVVSRGRIIARDNETSKETLGYSTPEEYWTEERVNALKERLRPGIYILHQLISRDCNC